jgi:hypothetical protein
MISLKEATMKRWFLLPLFALACSLVHADLYRWVDAEGKTHYSDDPPPSDIKQVEKKKVNGGKPGDAPLPYSLQQAVKNFPVTLYTSQCGAACTSARELLAKRGIPYTEMDATNGTVQIELKKLTGGTVEVPVLKVGSDATKGFEEGRWNSALDVAGYPQTALIKPQPPTKPAAQAPAAASSNNPAPKATSPSGAAK